MGYVSLRPRDAIPEYIPPEFLVDRLIPEGSVIILGTNQDTVRRSFLLQICAAVQSGRPLFDAFQVDQGGVIYTASGPGDLARAREITLNGATKLTLSP